MKLSNLFYRPPMPLLRQMDIAAFDPTHKVDSGFPSCSNRAEDATLSSHMLFRWWTLSSSYDAVK